MSTEDACVCKCRKGFTLRPDGKTCKSNSPRLPSHDHMLTAVFVLTVVLYL